MAESSDGVCSMPDGTFRLKGLTLKRDEHGTVHIYGITDDISEGMVGCTFLDDVPWSMDRPPMIHLHGKDGDVKLSGRAGVEYAEPSDN